MVKHLILLTFFTLLFSVKADDYGDSAATASFITVSGASITGTIDHSDDDDVFKAELFAGQGYVVTCYAGSCDPNLYVYGPTGILMGSSFDAFGLSARISFTAVLNGMHYFTAAGNDGSMGTYTMEVKNANCPVNCGRIYKIIVRVKVISMQCK